MFIPIRSYRSWTTTCIITTVILFLLTHVLLLRRTSIMSKTSTLSTTASTWQSWLRRPHLWTHSRDHYHNHPQHMGEKFLTFLPHSGLHNQRIALINAAILAGALNRTLLMPELNLGTATYWRPFEQLADRLANCPGHPEEPATHCYEYRDYVPVPVDHVFDLTPLHELGIRTMQRHNMRDDYFARYWAIDEDSKEDLMYTLDDQARYSYQIHDDLSVPNASLEQFQTRVDLQDLEARKELFIMFGSLFGSRRLAIKRTDLVHIRDYLRQRVGVKHPVVMDKSDEIITQLGGADNYLSVHLRQGDGRFKKEAKKTIEQIRRSMEKYAKNQSDNDEEENIGHSDNEEDDIVKKLQQIKDRSEKLEACVATQQKHKHTRLRLIYMATDTKNPQEKFTDLYDEFVCLFTLNDFPTVVQSIQDTALEVDPYLRNGNLLIPLVDGEVAAKADHFIPTPKSTFSGYIRQRNAQFHELT